MTAYTAFLLFLVAGVSVLRDQVDTIPPGQWRYQEFAVGPELPADVDCNFHVEGPGRVQVRLMTRENLRQLLEGREAESIVTSDSGVLHQEIGIPGNFALVVVNREKLQPTRVSMRATLDTTGRSLVKTRYLSPQRKFVVILSSFAGFFLIVTFSARKLLLAMKR